MPAARLLDEYRHDPQYRGKHRGSAQGIPSLSQKKTAKPEPERDRLQYVDTNSKSDGKSKNPPEHFVTRGSGAAAPAPSDPVDSALLAHKRQCDVTIERRKPTIVSNFNRITPGDLGDVGDEPLVLGAAATSSTGVNSFLDSSINRGGLLIRDRHAGVGVIVMRADRVR